MRFLVAGTGALGSALGSALALDGNDVTFHDRPARLEAVARDGLPGAGRARAEHLDAPQVAADVARAGRFDYVLLCVRTEQVDVMLDTLGTALAHDAPVVPMQPGLAATRACIDALGAKHVLPAVVEGTALVPGADALDVAVGEHDGSSSWRLEVLEIALTAAGIATRSSQRIGEEAARALAAQLVSLLDAGPTLRAEIAAALREADPTAEVVFTHDASRALCARGRADLDTGTRPEAVSLGRVLCKAGRYPALDAALRAVEARTRPLDRSADLSKVRLNFAVD